MSNKPTIFLSIPIMDRPEAAFMDSLYQAMLSCSGFRFYRMRTEGDSLLERVRNQDISLFMESDCEWFVVLDSDLIIHHCTRDDNLFNKLTGHGKEFVGGLYALRGASPIGQRCASGALDAKPLEYNTGLREMRWMSTGCWCIHRTGVERTVAAYPELDYAGDAQLRDHTVHGLFMPMLVPRGDGRMKHLSEDWSCCERFRAAGGQIWADTSIRLTHIGKAKYELWPVPKKEGVAS